MSKMQRRCVCCGKEYEFCPKCSEHAGKPLWMFAYHNEACKDLWEIISAYSSKKASANEIRDVVLRHNITNYDVYSQDIAKILKDVMKNSLSVEPDKVETPVFIDNSIAIIDEALTEDTDTEKGFYRKNRRKQNIDNVNSDLEN